MKTYILIGCLLFVGCASMRNKMSGLNENMTKTEVLRRLGRPDGIRRNGEYQALVYGHRQITATSNDRADFSVILKNDKVIEYGMGEVRVKEDGGILFLVPLSLGK